MAATKKDIELWRLDRLKSFISDFPEGRLEPTEEPDFLVHGPSKVIGIELTDLHRETPPGQMPQQASEAMRNRIVARAKEIYESRKQPPVIATFFLDDRLHIKRAETELLATELANLVLLNVPAPNSSIEIPTSWDDFRPLPQILHSLSVRRLDVVTKTFFSNPGTTWVGTLSKADIERVLLSKEAKLANYRTKCDEAWLVINSDIESMATWFEFEPTLLEECFSTNFDRMYVVQHFRGTAHRLRIQKGGLKFDMRS